MCSGRFIGSVSSFNLKLYFMADQKNTFLPSRNRETAGFACRAMAYLIDLAIINGFLLILLLVAGQGLVHCGTLDIEGIIRGSITVVFLFVLIPPLLYLAYFSLLQSWSGQTIGKICLGIRVVTLDGEPLGIGRSVLRCAGSFLSALPLGAGFLWSVLDNRKRTWHDLLAGTEVVFSSNLP